MQLKQRLARLEKHLHRHQEWLSRSVQEMTHAELYAVVAQGTNTSAAELAALPDEALMAMVRDLCETASEPKTDHQATTPSVPGGTSGPSAATGNALARETTALPDDAFAALVVDLCRETRPGRGNDEPETPFAALGDARGQGEPPDRQRAGGLLG